MSRRRFPASPGVIGLLLAIVLLFALPAIVRFYVDWLWFGEVGYQSVFLRTLTAQATLALLAFLVSFLVLALNLRLAFATLKRREFEILTPDGPRSIAVDPGRLKPLAYLLAAIAGFLMASFASSHWVDFLLFSNWTAFGKTDPILGRDIGFFVFRLPFLQFLYQIALGLTVLSIASVAATQVFAGNVGIDARSGIFAHPSAVRHLSGLAAVLLVVLAFGAWLDVSDLLTSSSRILQGASYVDAHARIPALRALMAVSILGALLAAAQPFLRGYRLIAAALGLYLAVWLGGALYSAIVQRFVVAPNEQVRETPFISHNIAATRAAFALDEVEERQLEGDALLTRAEIDLNRATLGNVPLWNHQPLLDTFAQLQEIRTYYDFVSVDNDRYEIDGEYRQIMLSARELNSESLPSRTWINERLTFTHGYGLTLGPVNQVTPEGLPVLFIKDLPPASSVGLEVTQPALYFGELSNDHVFVRTATEEFDYPRGEGNVFASYEGSGGVELGGFFRRLLFAIRFRSTDTLLSPSLTSESRVLMQRRISDRVARIAPFLTFDRDPYLAIDEGRLVWVHDAYTTTARYPYSTPIGRINYIRNSVKATIDAFHGTTTFYVIDPADPIAATLAKTFPDLFEPLEAMPAGLRERLRYPQGIFQLQSTMFSVFHMTNPAVFYNKEDQWEVPSIDEEGRDAPMEPYYTIMKLPGETGAEYIQMLPYTPRQKDNLAAWMVARSDGEHYGKLMVFEFPKQTVVYGPAADRGAHQSGPGDFASDHSLESAGLRGDPGNAPGDSHRGVAPLYPAALSSRRRRTNPGAQTGHRRVPEPDRDGGDARRIARAAVPGRCGASPPRNSRAHDRSIGSRGSRKRARAPEHLGRAGARPLSSSYRGAAPRRLGALRRGDPEARRAPRADEREPPLVGPFFEVFEEAFEIASISRISLGAAKVRTLDPPRVTSTSSSMRTPIPRYFSFTRRSAGPK